MRLEFNWGAIIGQNAAARDPAQLNWDDVRCGVQRATSRGLNVLGILEYTPDWAVSDARVTVPDPSNPGQPVMLSKQRFTPDDMQDWVRFVQAAVSTFPQVRYWAIWNEPNTTTFFYGDSAKDSTDARIPNRVATYNRLLATAAPIIHAAGGSVAGPELGLVALGGTSGQLNTPTRQWLQGVFGAQGASIDVAGVHFYASDLTSTQPVMYNLPSNSGVAGWRWPVWLTEVGLQGCNDLPAGATPPSYCSQTSPRLIDDNYQSSHLANLMSSMRNAPASSYWAKSFYWHSHASIADAGENWGILSGATSGTLTPRPAYWTYASIASPLTVTGSTGSAAGQNVTVTATPAVPGSYYYVWEYQWCYNGTAPHDCDPPTVWYHYDEGQGLTSVAPYVYPQDYYVNVRVRQYAYQNGPQISGGEWDISGQGQCSTNCGGGGGMYAAPSPTPERQKGRQGAKNK